MRKLLFIFSFILVCTSSNAQKLSLDDAINMYLSKNFQVQILNNNLKIAENNKNIGTAGFLPKVDLNSNVNQSITDANLKFAGGLPEVNRKGASNFSVGTGLTLTQTIYAGLNAHYQLKKQGIAINESDIRKQIAIENSVQQLIITYLDITRQAEQIKILQEQVVVSSQKVKRFESRMDFGGSKLDYLSAKVNFNTDTLNLVQAYSNLSNSNRNLAVLLGSSPDTKYDLENEIKVSSSYILAALLDSAANSNAELLLATIQFESLKMDEKILSSTLQPRLGASAGYNYSLNKSDVSIVLENRNVGPQAGLSLSWNLYDGNKKAIQMKNIKLQQENQSANLNELKWKVEANVKNQFEAFNNAVLILKMEENNLEFAKLNFQKATEQMDFGLITLTQFREAQTNYFAAQNKIVNQKINLKNTEIALLRSAGMLIKE